MVGVYAHLLSSGEYREKSFSNPAELDSQDRSFQTQPSNYSHHSIGTTIIPPSLVIATVSAPPSMRPLRRMNMDIRSIIGFAIRQLCDCVCIQLSRRLGVPETRLAVALYEHCR
jgi:hypothetical protein